MTDDDVGGAAGDVIVADVLRDHVHRIDAVLQRDHHGIGTDQRRQCGRRRIDVIQLHGEEHDVDRTDGLRAIRRLHFRHVHSPSGLVM